MDTMVGGTRQDSKWSPLNTLKTLAMNQVWTWEYLKGIQLGTFLTHPNTSMTELNGRFYYRYSGPSSYNQPDMKITWVTTGILILTYHKSLEL